MGSLLCTKAFPHPGKPQKSGLCVANLLQQEDANVFRGAEPSCRLMGLFIRLAWKKQDGRSAATAAAGSRPCQSHKALEIITLMFAFFS
jgi:hypothetical protein